MSVIQKLDGHNLYLYKNYIQRQQTHILFSNALIGIFSMIDHILTTNELSKFKKIKSKVSSIFSINTLRLKNQLKEKKILKKEVKTIYTNKPVDLKKSNKTSKNS